MDKWTPIDLDGWIQELLERKPEGVSGSVNRQYKELAKAPKKDRSELYKVAVITDLHMDWDYTPGMSADCGHYVCCRSESGLPHSPDKAAGKWGDFQCDIPLVTLENMLDYVKNEVKPDAVFWGGDSISHNVESLTVESNVEVMKNTTQVVVDRLQGLPIFPTMGNHDTYP